METKKINVQSCNVLKDMGTYKTYKVIDTDGNQYGATQEFEPGEQEVEVTINGAYTNIKKIKPKGSGGFKPFAPKDYKFEKKELALKTALTLKGSHDLEWMLDTADKIENWLNK